MEDVKKALNLKKKKNSKKPETKDGEAFYSKRKIKKGC